MLPSRLVVWLCVAWGVVPCWLPTPAASGGDTPPPAEGRQEAGKEAPDGGDERVIARKSVGILEGDAWDSYQRRLYLKGLNPGPVVQKMKREAERPGEDSLGYIQEISENDQYIVTRRQTLPPANRPAWFCRIPDGYVVEGADTIWVFDRSGKVVLRQQPASVWAVSRNGHVGLYNNARGTSSSDIEPTFSMPNAKGKVVFSVPLLYGSVVDITPDGKILFVWRPRGGHLSGPAIYKTSGKNQPKEGEFKLREEHYVTDDGSVIGTLTPDEGEGRTIVRVSSAGKCLYRRNGAWWLKEATGDGKALVQTTGNPRHLLVLDERGNTALDLEATSSSRCLLLRDGYYAAVTDPGGKKEEHVSWDGRTGSYYADARTRIYDLRTGQPVSTIEQTFLEDTSTIIGDTVVTFNPFTRLLILHDLKSGAKIRHVVLRHEEPLELKVDTIEMKGDLVRIQLTGKSRQEGSLVEYTVKLKPATP